MYIRPLEKRMIVVCGHYGSGKTEFSVSLAMLLSADPAPPFPRLSLVDLDVVNPYFRSRERTELLEKAGVTVRAGIGGININAEVPAIDPAVRGPLEDKGSRTIVDLGGNDSGARISCQFSKYFTPEDTLALAVVNGSRPDTADAAGAAEQIGEIEKASGIAVTGIINNTHLLMETTPEVIARGHALCEDIYKITGLPLYCDCYPAPLLTAEQVRGIGEHMFPMGMYMRPGWLDK